MILAQSWHYAFPQLLTAVGLSAAFAFVAWGMRSVTAGAAITGFLLTGILCFAAGSGALLPVLTVFLLTYFTTRIGHRKKERLGTAERRRGRGALQILANVGVASICATPLLYSAHARYILLAGTSAALAEAAGDTVSSELGQALGGTPRLITTLRRVSVGRDGAITLIGTLCSLLAIAVVCLCCQWTHLLLPQFYWTVFAAAFVGTILDSLLGATLERPGLLGNDSVNFTSTAFAAALAIVLQFAHRWL
jgi:uncharacterized protein (TIGR00297 family)